MTEGEYRNHCFNSPQMPDEEAFSLLVRLMYSYDVRGHFLPEMPKLLLRLVNIRHPMPMYLFFTNIHF